MKKHLDGVAVPKQGKGKKPSISKLKKKLWTIFSLYIRTRDNFNCFTCSTRYGYIGHLPYPSAIQAGHFIPKSAGGLSLYFNEDNVHAQCYHCNINLGGNQYEYGQRLGEEKVKELYQIKQQTIKWGIFEYEEKINEYKAKLESLESK